jgi:Domain of unknown function DUF29
VSGKVPAAHVAADPSRDDAAAAVPRVSDYYAWSREQAAHLRAGRFDQVDLLNVADEIEDVGKSEKRELRSNLENVLVHILKWEHQPQRRGRSWALSIAEHRRRVLDNLADNPSLAGDWDEMVSSACKLARLRAARETNLSLDRLADECPYDRQAIMDAVFEIDES